MIHYDFIEIGTSDFDSISQTSLPEHLGISVEPLEQYLKKLPNNQHVTKICAALVTSDQYTLSDTIDVYYVDEDTITQQNLGIFMKGCNSVGKLHELHTEYYHDLNAWSDNRSQLLCRNLADEGLVSIANVKCLTWGMLMDKQNIGTVSVLKTDTEGMDADLLIDIANEYIKRNKVSMMPATIQFEDRGSDRMALAKQLLGSLGYTMSNRYSTDCDPDSRWDTVATRG